MNKFIISMSKTHGKGLFAARDIDKDERISYILGKIVERLPKTRGDSKKMRTWFGISRRLWINPERTAFKYLNHSCEPNAGIIGRKTLVAMQQIKKGIEITIDYSMSDADPYLAMNCHCGARLCRKIIRPIQALSPDVYHRHMPYIPRYFQQLYLRSYSDWGLKSIRELKRSRTG